MSIGPYILLLPDIALEKIFSFLSYDEIAQNRLACLSIDNVQKVMIFGQSKDFGTCKSTKKDGTPCTAFVNLSKCDFCVYHVGQEYQKCSKRSDLQSTFQGRGLNALRNKVLGKNEVFYAGKSFSAIPAAKSRKLQAKDQGRLNLLSGLNAKSNNISKAKHLTNSGPIKKAGWVQHVEISASRRLKDMELLKKLGGSSKELEITARTESENAVESTGGTTMATSAEVTLQESKSTALSVIAKLKAKKAAPASVVDKNNEVSTRDDVLDEHQLSDLDFGLSDEEVDTNLIKEKENKLLPEPAEKINKPEAKPSASTSTKKPQTQYYVNGAPKLGTALDIPILSGIGNKMVDLSSPITKKHVNRANVNALKWVKTNGPIQKQDPNSAKTTPKGGKKRALASVEKQDPKRQKIQENEHFSQRFKQMMAASSAHKDLLEEYDNDEAEKYFSKLEMKEKMEEKMTSTFKVQCKAVKCLHCKYTSFSAADRCKQEKHPLKVFDAMKRFFKCGDCGNRTVSLNVIPTQGCKKCGSGKWERAGMMKEKIVAPRAELSIRGGEQAFVHSNVTNANINLLVPDD